MRWRQHGAVTGAWYPSAIVPSLLLALLAPVAHAATGESLVIAPFYAVDPASKAVATKLEASLEETLATGGDYEPSHIEHTLLVGKMNALNYLEGCGAAGFIPCLFIVSREINAHYAVSGVAHPSTTGVSVSVTVLDVQTRHLLQTGTFEVAPGADNQLADSVTQFIRTAIAEGAPPPETSHGPIGQGESTSAVAKELEALPSADELVGDEPAATRSKDTVTYNLQPLAEGGAGEWEKLGYNDADWLDYQQSGLSMDAWRVRAMGLAGQVLVRPFAGVQGGPNRAIYYHRHAYDDVTGQVADSYTSESARPGVAPIVGIELGYGLTSSLSLSCELGWAPGSVTTDIVAEDASVGTPIVMDVPAASWSVTPRVEVVLRPTKKVHPAFGAGFALHRMPTISTWLQQVPDAEALPSHWLGDVEVWPGLQLETGHRIDVYGRVPIGVHVLGSGLQEDRITTVETLSPEPPRPWAWGTAAIEVGLSLRFGGLKPRPIPTILVDSPKPTE